KRLGLLHELLPTAERFAILVNPNNRNAEALTRDAQATASAIGRQIEIFNASSTREIDAAFVNLLQKRADALLVSPDPLFDSRRVQLVTLATHHRLPTIYPFRENVEIGGLMSYGSSAAERDRQVGIYTGTHPQGGESGRAAGDTGGQVRVRHQPSSRKSPGPQRTAGAARYRRRGDRMRRREFITLLSGAAATWPFAAGAQQGERMRRIGVLMLSAADDPEFQARITAFVQGLAPLGWLDGRNLRIDTRGGAADADRVRKYAAELVALAPDVILANSSAAIAPLLQATRTVPIVFTAVADPVAAGYVDSLARPGGNATGFLVWEYSIAAKWL